MGRGCSRYHPIWHRHAAGPASDKVRENPFSCRRGRKSTPDMLAPTSLSRNVAKPSPPKLLQQSRWMGDLLPRLTSGIAPTSGSLCAHRHKRPISFAFFHIPEYDTRFFPFCKGFCENLHVKRPFDNSAQMCYHTFK